MADNVCLIAKVLCGSFYVNSERFSGRDKVFHCKSCGNYHYSTQLEREEFLQRVSDKSSYALLYTIFVNTETLQEHCHGNMENI